MARGWESKAVEAQQQDADARRRTAGPALTDEEQQRAQKRQGLLLARARTEADLARATGAYADMLQRQRAAIDAQLTQLDAGADDTAR